MKSITTTAAVALGMLWGLSSQVNAFVVLQRTSSPGCGKELPAAQMPPGGKSHMTNFTQSDGTKRHYLIHIPSNYEKSTPVPLIFSFHGRTKTAEEQEGLSQFSNENFNPNAIAVYPQGIGKGVCRIANEQDLATDISRIHGKETQMLAQLMIFLSPRT